VLVVYVKNILSANKTGRTLSLPPTSGSATISFYCIYYDCLLASKHDDDDDDVKSYTKYYGQKESKRKYVQPVSRHSKVISDYQSIRS